MLFKPELIEKIKAGDKTQTRRPSNGERFVEDGFTKFRSVHHKNGTLKWHVGKRYALVPKRGANGVGFIQLIAIERQKLGELTPSAALAEGFASQAEFFAYWSTLYAGEIDLNQSVWVLFFEYIQDEKE